jgi:hypothetical protein
MKDGRKLILWVLPVFQSVYPDPLKNFLEIALHAGANLHDTTELMVHVPKRELLHSAMNRAAAMLLSVPEIDGMIVSDDDCLPTFTAIPRLLARADQGHKIVAGIGFTRNFPHVTTVGRYFQGGPRLHFDPMAGGKPTIGGYKWLDDVSAEPELMDCDFCGFPIAYIDRAVFDAIEPDWFGTNLDGGSCTHDVYFGAKAKRAGFQIKVDRHVECGHLGEPPIVTWANRDVVRRTAAAWNDAMRAEPNAPPDDALIVQV